MARTTGAHIILCLSPAPPNDRLGSDMQEVVGIYNADGTIGGELLSLAAGSTRFMNYVMSLTAGTRLGNARGKPLSNSLILT